MLRKVTRDGTGTFPFQIRDEDGDVIARPCLTTRAAGGVGAARVLRLDPGRYQISERRPGTRQGVWRLSGISCNGAARPAGEPVRVTITARRGASSTFTNRLDGLSRITVRTATIGGLGTAGYVVTSRNDKSLQARQLSTTQRHGARARARSQSTQTQRFGSYRILQTAITAAQRTVWSLIAVTCNGHVVAFEQGSMRIRLTPGAPAQQCTFVDLRQRDPVPPLDPVNPGADTPTEPRPLPRTGPGAGEATPDLALEKALVRSTGGPIPTSPSASASKTAPRSRRNASSSPTAPPQAPPTSAPTPARAGACCAAPTCSSARSAT